MKQTPYDMQLEANLQKGVLCREGFLGTDHRKILEIIAADTGVVNKLGTSHEDIAAKLGKILKQAMERYGNPVNVAENLVAVYREAMGRIPCPWPHCSLAPKGEVELVDTAGDRIFRFSPLSVHTIAMHGFYGGKGSRYRLEPKQLQEVLERA